MKIYVTYKFGVRIYKSGKEIQVFQEKLSLNFAGVVPTIFLNAE